MRRSRLAFAFALAFSCSFPLRGTCLLVLVDGGESRVTLVVAVVHVATVATLNSLLRIEAGALPTVPPLAWHWWDGWRDLPNYGKYRADSPPARGKGERKLRYNNQTCGLLEPKRRYVATQDPTMWSLEPKWLRTIYIYIRHRALAARLECSNALHDPGVLEL